MAQIFETNFDSYVCEGETIEGAADGWHYVATVERDQFYGAPWEEHDGHGSVSDWRRKGYDGHYGKAPGELLLCEDSHSCSARFYDYAAACRTALADGWNCAPYDIEGETGRQRAARAARNDFEALRSWCNDEWFWCCVSVTVSREGVELGTASLCGIECNYPAATGQQRNSYLGEVAEEIAGEALAEAEATLARLAESIAA